MKDEFLVSTIRRAMPHLQVTTSQISSWISGYVVTQRGIVTVFSNDARTTFNVVKDRKMISRTIYRKLTERQIITLACRHSK